MYRLIKKAVFDFFEDDAMTQGAAIAFYAGLSFAPLLVLILWSGSFLGVESQSQVTGKITEILGPEAGEAVGGILRSSHSRPDLATIAGIVGLFFLFFSASGVFAQLQSALNRIWNVRAEPRGQVFEWMRTRFISAALILTVGLILLLSILLSAAVTFVLSYMQQLLPNPAVPLLLRAADISITLLMYTVLFAVLYKYLPDVSMRWSDVTFGAIVTALLFTIGRVLIGIYLGRSGVTSAYGAAGSLLALLVWVYYSALIFLLGAELTQAWVEEHGREILPRSYAVKQ